jgi:hypothetical protein
MIRNRIVPPLVVALGFVAAPAWSQSSITIDTAPPAARQEAPGAVREGYVWAPGYWNWQDNRHAWVEGHYVPARKGYRYQAPRWEEANGHWTLYPEQWVLDEDAKDKSGHDAPQWIPGRQR